MKKIVCILLSLVMVMSLSIVAFADSPANITSLDSESNSTGPIDVNASVSNTAEAAIVYSVEITWSVADTIALKNTDVYTWNPSTLKYEKGDSPNLSITTEKAEVEFNITNKSNAAVGYWVHYTKNNESGVNSAYAHNGYTSDKDKGNLGRADNAYASNLTNGVAGYTVSNTSGMSEVSQGEATSAAIKGYVGVGQYNTKATTDSIKVGTFTVTISQPYSEDDLK